LKNFFKETFFLNIAFGFGYFFLAKLGFEWGALTSNATLLWPPSGLALFGCMVFGRRAIPGLLIGAIVANEAITLSSQVGINLFSLVIASINGTASITQAIVISLVSQRWYRQGFQVNTYQAVYFTLAVLLGCTISATLSNIMLWKADVISLSIALQNWAVWWMGDSIGILIITPLLIWIYQRNFFEKHSQTNAFLIFCAGIGIVLLIVAAIGHNEREARRAQLLQEAKTLSTNLQFNIDLANRDMETLQEYFLNNTPTRDDFQTLISPLLKRNNWLNSISWIPAIDAPQKKQSSRFDPKSGLGISKNQQGDFVWYQPDFTNYSPELLGKVTAQVTASHSEVFWRDAATALESKTPYKIPFIHLVLPIYYCNQQVKSDCKIFNLLSGELNLNLLMQAVISQTPAPDINIQLSILSSNNAPTKWEWQSNHWQPYSEQNKKNFLEYASSIQNQIPTIKVLDNQWQLLISPRNLTLWFLPNTLQCIIFLVGSLLVSLLSAYLQALYRHDQLINDNQSRLEDEIKNQTLALRKANDWLLQEIDEKRTTQEQLKASENHLRTLLDNIPDPIWFKTNQGEYVSFNKAVEALFLRKEEEVAGKTAGDYTNPAFDEIIREFEHIVLASTQAARRELWMYIPARNENRLMDTIKVAVRDEQQNSIGILSIARDITEQHQIIDELGKFKRFAEYASEGFSIMSLTAETLYMNPSMQIMLTYNNQNQYQPFFNYFPQDLHAQWHTHILPYVLTNSYWQGELAALRSDGSRFPTKATFFIIRDDKGQPIYLGQVMIDISEQKQVEASLQLAKEAAEEATRAKSRFLANMSHEIRTPLNAILGYSQLLMVDSQLTTQQHERLTAISNAGQRLLHLINDILDLSKIEAGALHFRQDFFDLYKELNDIVALMRTKAMTKGLALKHDIQLPCPAIIKSDRQKIGQIILNLLGNAIKFTNSGEINLNVSMSNNVVFFNVIDTGPGIAAQELQLLFAAFKQGKAGEDSGGTGLGLVISKHIAENLGGELTLDSEPSKGTHAHLRLPLALENHQLAESTPPLAHSRLITGSHCKVLVVEDDDASRDVMVNLLRNIGCTVFEATDGAQGLTAALNNTFDIMFTDIRMPELSGTEMLKSLREKISKNDLPVIAVSASSLEHERTFYLAQGFHEFIGKPYQFQDIYKALKNFTRATFEAQEQDTNSSATVVADVIDWHKQPNGAVIAQQLETLKAAFNAGDMARSKKLFNQQSAETLGKMAHQKILNALRQYDLVNAELVVSELLTEIHTALSTH